mgnify:CR=1 FL=1
MTWPFVLILLVFTGIAGRGVWIVWTLSRRRRRLQGFYEEHRRRLVAELGLDVGKECHGRG